MKIYLQALYRMPVLTLKEDENFLKNTKKNLENH